MNPADIIERARTYAREWAHGYKPGQPTEREDYDEDPEADLEDLVRQACPCGCGPMRIYWAARELCLPSDESPSYVPSELVKYIEALVEQYEAVTKGQP